MTTTPTPQKDNSKPTNGSTGKPPTLDTKASDVTKPANEKPAETTTTAAPATAAAGPGASSGTTPPAAEKKARTGRKVFIVVGAVHEFNNTGDAEKFLNQSSAINEFTVIKGNTVEKKQKISLR